MNQAELDRWIRNAESWLSDSWQEFRRLSEQARERFGTSLEDSQAEEIRKARADLAAIREDVSNGAVELEHPDVSGLVPTALLVKAATFMLEMDERIREFDKALPTTADEGEALYAEADQSGS
jgi:hypothetical protein